METPKHKAIGTEMKTTTSEVRCDGCQDVISVLNLHGSGSNPEPIFVKLSGVRIGRKSLDFCTRRCFGAWCLQQYQEIRRE